MAIDTQEKRMNCAKVGRPFLRSKLATGTFDEQARINCGLGYGGNALSAGGITLLNYYRGFGRGMAAGFGRGMYDANRA